MTPLQLCVLDYVRQSITENGYSPLPREIANSLRLPNEAAARYQIDKLVGMGKLIKVPGRQRGVELPDAPDLSAVATGMLFGELARRGITIGSLAETPLPTSQGAPCAYEVCSERVGRGKLFCRTHWHAIPAPIRSRIFATFGARNEKAYAAAIDAARDALDRQNRQVRRAEMAG